jgi:hypothetical protein
MDEALGELCVNGVFKPKHKHLEDKGLINIPHLPQSFQIKWIRYILRRVHNSQLWLEQSVLITKKMIYHIIGLPMLSKAKATKTLGQVELEKKTLSNWDGRGTKISSVKNVKSKFGIHVVAHKIYSSSHLNSVSCEVVDLAFKVMKNNLSYDLANLY